MKKLKKIQLTSPETEETEITELAPVPAEGVAEPLFPEIGMWFEKVREKIKPFPWKKINGKNAIVAGCLVLVAVAGYLNIRYGMPADIPVDEQENGEVSEFTESENFFASAQIDRERARGEALEVLVTITEDESASETAKSDAFVQMERIANETSWEIDIENLVKAKGFEECIAVINQDSANIIVESEGLTPAEIAQIKEIVFLESDILPKDVKIIEKSAS